MNSFAKILLPSSRAAAAFGPTIGSPSRCKQIDNARGEWRFRPHKSQVNSFRLGKLLPSSACRSTETFTSWAILPDSGISGRTKQLDGAWRRVPNGPDDGVLPPPRPDHQYFLIF